MGLLSFMYGVLGYNLCATLFVGYFGSNSDGESIFVAMDPRLCHHETGFQQEHGNPALCVFLSSAELRQHLHTRFTSFCAMGPCLYVWIRGGVEGDLTNVSTARSRTFVVRADVNKVSAAPRGAGGRRRRVAGRATGETETVCRQSQ